MKLQGGCLCGAMRYEVDGQLSVCGSSLGMPTDGKLGSVALGTPDTDPGARPSYHMFTGSKAAWYEITDALPQFDAWPPKEMT